MRQAIPADGGSGSATDHGMDPGEIAIAISVYRPDMNLLRGLIASFAGRFPRLYLQIDGPVGEAIEAADLAELERHPTVRIGQAETNQGIASALNRLAEAAKRDGCRFILYFDQDSEPETGLPKQLLNAFENLQGWGMRPAAIGPRPVPHDPARSKGPRYRPRSAQLPLTEGAAASAVDYLITSGTLIELEALKTIGPFTERFRIDAVDIEWCFRAWSRGFSVWLLEWVTMPHRIGSGVVRFGPIAFPEQNAARMETYLRNQFQMLRLGYVPLAWKLRTLAYVPAQALIYAAGRKGTRLGTARVLFYAAWQGLRGR